MVWPWFWRGKFWRNLNRLVCILVMRKIDAQNFIQFMFCIV